MRRWASPAAIFAVSILLISAFPIITAGAEIDQASNPIFLLVRVAPSTPLEFVTVQNVSNHSADLAGWAIDDGEGWIRINVTTELRPGGRISFCPDPVAFSSYYPDEMVIGYRDTTTVRHSTFTLADKGDQLELVSARGAVTDSFCFGASAPCPGWCGDPFTPLPKGDMAVRNVGLRDTNSSADWYRSCAGRSEQDSANYDAQVDPFTSPEGAQGRMIREFGYATLSIDACVYELGNPVITEIFSEAASRGVKVTLLIEGQPVAGLSNSSKTAITSLIVAGCDVRLMVSNQSYRRYDCLHAKYFVVDRERVTVMSENWAGGLTSNRGWGVTVISRGLAGDMMDMFAEDSSLDRRDVKTASSLVKDWYGPQEDAVVPEVVVSASAPMVASVKMIASPDTSYQGILELVSSANTRLLIEQLYIDPAWVGKNLIVDELVEAAERGVQVRVLLDQTFVDTSSTRNNSMTVDALNALGAERGVDLQAGLVSDYHDIGVMHNKGVVADDRVLVSSINWADASVFQNREVGLILSSPAVSAFFADRFWQDWAIDPDPPTIVLPWYRANLTEGQPIVLDARESNDNAGISSFAWRDGLNGAEWNGSFVMAFLGLGVHNLTLIVTDRFGNTATAEMLVIVQPSHSVDQPNILLIVPAGAFVLAVVLWFLLRKLNKL